MIGQTEILERLDKQCEEDLLPRFLMFVGPEGMGKKTLMREFAKKHWKIVIELSDVKVDSIRGMISEAYKLSSPTVYIIPDADRMSVNAKNSLLKVTEEPPNKATFLMSITSMEQTLETIKSRGTAYYMRPYSVSERLEYIKTLDVAWSERDLKYVMMISNSIYDIVRLSRIDPGELESYAKKLVDNINKVSVANALKTSGKIKFKDDDKGEYELDLLFRACMYVMAENIYNESKKPRLKMYRDMMDETMLRMNDLNNLAISKPNTYDMWLLNCRKIMKEYKNGIKQSKSTD